jgi:hypothetical protein
MSKSVFIASLLFAAVPIFGQNLSESYTSTILAGRPAAPVTTDGVGADARFQSITAMWGDGKTLYVADSNTIRSIDLASAQVTTIAQTASSGQVFRSSNTGFDYVFGGLYGLWGDGTFLYGTDVGAHALRQISLQTGGVRTLADTLSLPWGVSGDGTNVYVAEADNGRIDSVDRATGSSSVLATTGRGTPNTCFLGSGCLNYFPVGPRGAWGDGSSLYVSGYSGTLKKIDIGSGAIDVLPAAPFNIGPVTGTSDRLFVASINGAQLGSIARDTGVFTAIPVPSNIVSIPAFWSDGSSLYVAVGGYLSAQAIERIDLSTGEVFPLAGFEGNPLFQSPEGVWGDGTSLYLADRGNCVIRKIDIATGTVTTFAGQAGQCAAAVDGFGTAAAFVRPRGLWGDGAHLYVTDAFTIRSIDLSTAQVQTLAGAAAQGFVDGTGSAARFRDPIGLWGMNGILYIADSSNTAVRKLDLASNQVTTLAGQFFFPESLWSDGSTLFVGDRGSIRTIDLATATVQTFTTLPAFPSQAMWGNSRALYVLGGGSLVQFYRVDLATKSVTEPVHDADDPLAGRPFSFHGGFGLWGDGSNLYISNDADAIVRRLSPAPPPPFARAQIPNPGFVSIASTGASAATSVGYGKITVDSGNVTLAGLAIFSLRQDGVLVSQASAPALPPILSGRIPFWTTGAIEAGLAIANPNTADAVISFYFTDSSGSSSAQGLFTLPGGAQMARFLTEAPYNGAGRPDGTFTFISSIPVSAVALRGFINERSEFLMTTLPVLDLSRQSNSPLTIAHFASGGGWNTELVLVNPSNQAIAGTVQPLGLSAGATTPTLSYAIPARASQEFTLAASSSTVSTGALQVLPSSGPSPGTMAIYSFVNQGIRVIETAVPDAPASTAFRVYAQTGPGKRNGFAITNTSNLAQDVKLELLMFNGMNFVGNPPFPTRIINVPAQSHVAMFLDEVPFLGQQSGFPGAYIMRLSTANAAGVSVTGLLGTVNERGELIMTSSPAVAEDSVADPTPRYIAHIVDGGGFSTQVVLFSGTAQSAVSGFSATTQYVTPSGTPLILPIQ